MFRSDNMRDFYFEQMPFLPHSSGLFDNNVMSIISNLTNIYSTATIKEVIITSLLQQSRDSWMLYNQLFVVFYIVPSGTGVVFLSLSHWRWDVD